MRRWFAGFLGLAGVWGPWPSLNTALAGEIAVVVPSGALRPLVPTPILVSATGAGGVSSLESPRVKVDGKVHDAGAGPEPGVFALTVTPSRPGPLRVEVDVAGMTQTVELPVARFPTSTLVIPPKVDAQAGDRRVTFRVSGADLPPPELLDVSVAEGAVLGVSALKDAIEVAVDPGASEAARVVAVAVRDVRREVSPSFSVLRLRARAAVDLQTEPGATVNVAVGRRNYGPFKADASGVVRPVMEQYPGESAAQLTLVDDLGNETRSSLALNATARASLVALVSDPLVPGQLSPGIFLHGVHGDGHDWAGRAPVCHTAAAENLPVVAVDKAFWYAALPTDAPRRDLRVRCTLGEAAEAMVRVEATRWVAREIALRVWPDRLSSDLPTAEVQAILLDSDGDRMAAQGLTLAADYGRIERLNDDGVSIRSEYAGFEAVDRGGDAVRARFDTPAAPVQGAEFVRSLTLGHSVVSANGRFSLFIRALDRWGRPVAGVALTGRVGERRASGTTGQDGWAEVPFVLPPGSGPLRVEAATAWRSVSGIVPREAPAIGGPGTPDLLVERWLPIAAGRVRRIDVSVHPSILYTGPRAVAQIRAKVLDGSGREIRVPPTIEVSEGNVGTWTSSEDGGFVAQYTPSVRPGRRDVRLTLQSESATAQAALRLESRPVDRSIGFAVGGAFNFGAVQSPSIALDLESRTDLLDRQLFIRAGMAWWTVDAAAATGLGGDLQLRTMVFPTTLAAVARREVGPQALWGGVGGVISAYRSDARFGDDERYVGWGVYPPGFTVLAGWGYRLPLAELFVEARGVALVSPGGSVAWQGSIGGLTAYGGYRVIF